MELLRLARNPSHVAAKVGEYGFGRAANEIGFKKMGLPRGVVQKFVRGAKIARHPADYAARKFRTSSYLRGATPKYRIDPDLGYRSVPTGGLPGMDNVLKICQQIYRDALPKLDAFGGRYGINLLTSDMEAQTDGVLDLRDFPELLEFASSEALLANIVDYLGEVPVLASIGLVVTTPMTENIGSNLFHFDQASQSLVKFWLAVDDVVPGSGPLTFFDATASKKIWKQTGYVSGRLTDEQVYDVVPESEKLEFLGKAGEGMLVDTCRCVHFGSRARERNRVVLMLSFYTKFWWAEPTLYFCPTLFDNAPFKNDPVKQQVLDLLVNGPEKNRKTSQSHQSR
jgi:hypothetical protein